MKLVHVVALVSFGIAALGIGLPTVSLAAGAFQWQTATPESQGMSSQKLDALKDVLAAQKTATFLVVRNDKIVYEWYGPNSGPKKLHSTASLAKAIVGGVATAVALTDGKVALDDKVAKYVPQWKSDPRKSKITIRRLGSHTSGLDDSRPNEEAKWKDDFWKRMVPPNDPFTISRDITPVQFEPGEKERYSNPGIAMLTYALTAALRDAPEKDVRTLLRERVMRPIGAPDEEWSIGYGKTFLVDGLPLVAAWGGGSYTARTAARVGRLMLREGNWEGKQLLFPEAVQLVTSDAGTPKNGGIGWWSNNDGTCPKLPKDAYWGHGAGLQLLLVVPSLKLIAVRNGVQLDPQGKYGKPETLLFNPLIEAITK